VRTDNTRHKYLRRTSILRSRYDASKAGEQKKAPVTLRQSMIDHGEEGSMQPRTCLLYAFTLSTAMTFGAEVMAGDLPKEGMFSGTGSTAGTYKAYPVGKDRTLLTWDENGLSVGNGLLDHVTWHCFGLQDIASGMEQFQGYCVATDPAGDQIVSNVVSDGKHATGAKSYGAIGTFTTGTGKYAGISGGWTVVLHSPDFRTAAEGTYVQYSEIQAKYKLP
jgi:hypothetical protein